MYRVENFVCSWQCGTFSMYQAENFVSQSECENNSGIALLNTSQPGPALSPTVVRYPKVLMQHRGCVWILHRNFHEMDRMVQSEITNVFFVKVVIVFTAVQACDTRHRQKMYYLYHSIDFMTLLIYFLTSLLLRKHHIRCTKPCYRWRSPVLLHAAGRDQHLNQQIRQQTG